MKKLNRFFLLAFALVVLLVAVVVGSSSVSFREVFLVLSQKLFSWTGGNITQNDITIVWNIRLPRVIIAFGVGAALSAAGTIVQSVLQNPLASPFTLGVSSGASLGASMIMVTGFSLPLIGYFTMPLFGFLFGIISVFLVITFSYRVDKTMSNHTIILAGMVFSLFFNAIMTVIMALSQENLKNLVNWQMGSFSMRSWQHIGAAVPFLVVGLGIALRYLREMDILTFGEQQAMTLGVETVKVKRNLLIAAAILTGSAIAVSGTIGFVDLVAPHLARKLVGSKHRDVLWSSMVVGGTMLVAADTIARTILAPSELPVGAITALIGAPVFGYIFFKRR